MLDVRRLYVLTAVVGAGSVTAAANQLGYTASAVSQNISALEREAGLALLEKAGRGVRPTQAGLLLADHADAVIARLREAEAALAALRAGQAGRLRVVAFATAGATLVPQALATFRSAHPAVELDLDVGEPDEALTRLRAGQIDVAVVALGDPYDGDDAETLSWVHLLDDEFRAAVPRAHHLAGRRAIPLQELAHEPWVVTDSSRCCSVATVTRACATAGFDPHVAIEADEFATALGFVNAGLGVALLPLLALSSIPDGVRVRRLRDEPPARYVYAVTRQVAARDVMVSSMMQSLQESAQAYRPAVS